MIVQAADEGGAQDDDVALQPGGDERAGDREQHDDERMRIAFDLRPDHVGDERPQPGTDERDPHEIGGQQQQRAEQTADDGGNHHRRGVAHPKDRAGRERPENEAEDAEDEFEETIAEETGDQAAADQENGGRQFDMQRATSSPSIYLNGHFRVGASPPFRLRRRVVRADSMLYSSELRG